MSNNHKFLTPAVRPLAVAVALTSAAVFSTAVQAQQPSRGGASALLEEVVVTARKREEGAQEVPLSVTAFNSDQIETLKVRDLTNIRVGIVSREFPWTVEQDTHRLAGFNKSLNSSKRFQDL